MSRKKKFGEDNLVRIAQLLVLTETQCNSKSHSLGLVFPRCLPFYSESNEDTTPFHKPGWIPVKNASLFVSNTEEFDSLCPKPWQYVTASELKAKPIQGEKTAYLGGGFVANLGYNSESAFDVIESLEDNCWIDDRTVAVLIECTLIEPATSFFSFMRYLYERFPTGGVITSGTVKTVTVYLPHGSESYRSFYQVSQVLLMLVILIFVIIEIAKVFQGGRIYFQRFWSWIDILLICFAASGIGIMLYKEGCAREYVNNVRANPFDNWNADKIIFWSEIEDYVLSMVMFVVTIKSLRLFRFNPHIYQMRTTLRDSVTPLSSFAVVLLVVIMAFALFAFLSFGSSVLNYSTLPQAVRTLLQMVIGGKAPYYQLKFATDSFLGPLFLFVYLITAMAILLNMFIAILNESYTMSREEKERTKDADDIDYVELFQYLTSCVKASIRSCYNFCEFVRLSFCNRKNSRKYQVNGYHIVHAPNSNVPRLASMDSLDEIQYPILSHAEELLSKVQLHLRKLSDGTIQENSETEQDTDQEGSCSDSELEFNSDWDSFLEGNVCNSSTPSTLIIDGNVLYDRLSTSDISDTLV